MSLTDRQAAVLRYLQRHIRAQGVVPTLADMAAELGLRSAGSLGNMISRLEERGFVRRTPGRRQSLVVVHQIPDPEQPDAAPIAPPYAPPPSLIPRPDWRTSPKPAIAFAELLKAHGVAVGPGDAADPMWLCMEALATLLARGAAQTEEAEGAGRSDQ